MVKVPDYLTRALLNAARNVSDNISIMGPPAERILRVTTGGVVWRITVEKWPDDGL